MRLTVSASRECANGKERLMIQTRFSWETASESFAVRLNYDHLIWSGQPKDDPRGGGESMQTIDDFRQKGAPSPFAPSADVLTGLRDLLADDAWKQLEQWETCVVTVDRFNRQTTIMRHGNTPYYERHEGTDEALIHRLLEKVRAEGWEFVKTFDGQSISSHS